jgi:hypothetical protein
MDESVLCGAIACWGGGLLTEESVLGCRRLMRSSRSSGADCILNALWHWNRDLCMLGGGM